MCQCRQMFPPPLNEVQLSGLTPPTAIIICHLIYSCPVVRNLGKHPKCLWIVSLKTRHPRGHGLGWGCRAGTGHCVSGSHWALGQLLPPSPPTPSPPPPRLSAAPAPHPTPARGSGKMGGRTASHSLTLCSTGKLQYKEMKVELKPGVELPKEATSGR